MDKCGRGAVTGISEKSFCLCVAAVVCSRIDPTLIRAILVGYSCLYDVYKRVPLTERTDQLLARAHKVL